MRQRAFRQSIVERAVWATILLALVVSLAAIWPRLVEGARFIIESPAFPLWKSEAYDRPYAIGIVNSVLYTLLRVLLGTSVGFATGVAIGLTLSQLRFLGRRLHGVLLLLAPLAPLVWMPLLLVLLGIGELTAALTVASGSVFVAAIVVYYLAVNCQERYIEVLRLAGANRWQIMKLGILPSMVPMLLLLFRLNLFAGWMAVLAAEMAGIDQGLGSLLMMGRSLGNVPVLVMACLMIAAASIVLDQVLAITASKLVSTRYGAWLFTR